MYGVGIVLGTFWLGPLVRDTGREPAAVTCPSLANAARRSAQVGSPLLVDQGLSGGPLRR